MIRFRGVLLIVLGIGLAPALAETAGVLLDEDEIAKVLRHGPWPVAPTPDPSNRVSGNPDAIAFGEALFFSPDLSADGALSCATCHNPEHGMSDGVPHPVGRSTNERNTLAISNLRHHRWFVCDGMRVLFC